MAYQYEQRQVTHGNAKGSFTLISQDETTGNIVYGTPYEFTGLRANQFDTTQDSTAYYADNVEHVRLNGNPTTAGTITTYQIRKQFFTDHLGKQFYGSGAMSDGGLYQNFVWIYNETITTATGQEYPEWHIFLNCKASAPTGASATDEQSTTPKEISIPVTASQSLKEMDSKGYPLTEIVWADPNFAVNAMYDGLFGDAPTTTIEEFIAAALGATPPTPPTP